MARDADPAILEALGELLAHRRRLAGQYYREYFRAGEEGEGHEHAGYLRGESARRFLARHGVGPGPADPARFPYYLLIVGDPESISYSFQHQLDVQFAVGRIHFDTLEGYASYARSVVAAETGQMTHPRRVAFFGTQHPGDQATQLSSTSLLQPLATKLTGDSDWSVQSVLGQDATKASLARLLGGEETPSVLFTACHGIGFPKGDPRQLPHQGALACQDWPGPSVGQPISPAQYFAADDVGGDARLRGLIAIHYASYSAGTPRGDEFALQALQQPVDIAPVSFVARLPQRLLSHPAGGALAAVGYAGRAWGYSSRSARTDEQRTRVFELLLWRLLGGDPVGHAMESVGQHYAELATSLSGELEGVTFGKVADPADLSSLWTGTNDGRNTTIVGDPAVRLSQG
jgi:hypothetical protein